VHEGAEFLQDQLIKHLLRQFDLDALAHWYPQDFVPIPYDHLRPSDLRE